MSELFKKHRKSKRLKRDFNISENVLAINSDDIKMRVNSKLNAEPSERKQYMKYKIFKGAAIAAAALTITTASVFAMSPAGQMLMENMISYFQNDKAVEISDTEKLAQYNESIGRSVSGHGYTLTLDNVVADDNFIHVFYTIKSEKPFSNGICPIEIAEVINGSYASNGNDRYSEAYLEDDYTVKGVKKISIASLDIPEKFKLEILGWDYSWNFNDEKLCRDLDSEYLTDEDKKNILYIETEIDKSQIEQVSVNKVVNAKINDDVEIEKIVLSPFGNQYVLKQMSPDKETGLYEFVIFDENGKSLDVLNVNVGYNTNGESAFEFLKANSNTRQLKFVPIKFGNISMLNEEYHEIGNYPIEYNQNQYGKVIVTGISFKDGEIDIDYYKDGFVLYDPAFKLKNKDGSLVDGGEHKFSWTVYTDVHYKINSYTARYVYENYDNNGKLIPPGDEVNAEELKNNLASLGIMKDSGEYLDFDNAITVDLR